MAELIIDGEGYAPVVPADNPERTPGDPIPLLSREDIYDLRHVIQPHAV